MNEVSCPPPVAPTRWCGIERFGCLTVLEREGLAALIDPPITIAKHGFIRREGDPVRGAFLLHTGWVSSSVLRRDGGRMVTTFHLQGDILGGPSLAMEKAAESLTAMTAVSVSRISLSRLATLFEQAPRLAMFFLLQAQHERVALGDQMVALGRSNAESRMAFMLLTIYRRVRDRTTEPTDLAELPLRLTDIADMLGLTTVHVSRTLTKLMQRRLIRRLPRGVRILDIDGLQLLADAHDRGLPIDMLCLQQGGGNRHGGPGGNLLNPHNP